MDPYAAPPVPVPFPPFPPYPAPRPVPEPVPVPYPAPKPLPSTFTFAPESIWIVPAEIYKFATLLVGFATCVAVPPF